MDNFNQINYEENNDGMGIIFIVIIIFVCLSIIIAGGVFIFTNNSGSTKNKPTDTTGNQIDVPGNTSGNTSGNTNTTKKPITTTKKPITTTKKPITTKRPGLENEPDEEETTTPMPTTTKSSNKDENECPSNTNRIGNLCWYDRGAGEFPGCSSGSVKKGVECYKKPPEGWDWTTEGGLMIGKKCPSNVNDSGSTCWYDRGIGTAPDLKPCAEGLRDDGVSCWRDTYGRGAGRSPNLHPCASGERDDGSSCWLDSYGRGWGRSPDKAPCQSGETDDGTSCWVHPDTYRK